LAGEADRGAALLESAGAGCQVHLADVTLPRAAEEALAWGVREAVTNVLRHSAATTCTIATSRREGSVRLEVTNDGVPTGPAGDEGARAVGEGGPAEGEGRSDAAGKGLAGTGVAGTGVARNELSGNGLAGNGPGGSRKGPAGGGLTGLAERAAHAGGTVDAGPTTAGGFRLTMEVPA
ncbi:hypothetical protein JYK22_12440, partial [Nonomuraea sp. RK-328]|nr:hypothetical protein [Nonomuraea sp. RK-328]